MHGPLHCLSEAAFSSWPLTVGFFFEPSLNQSNKLTFAIVYAFILKVFDVDCTTCIAQNCLLTDQPWYLLINPCFIHSYETVQEFVWITMNTAKYSSKAVTRLCLRSIVNKYGTHLTNTFFLPKRNHWLRSVYTISVFSIVWGIATLIERH